MIDIPELLSRVSGRCPSITKRCRVDQRDDRAGAVNAQQQVTLPVTGHGPVRGLSGPVADVEAFGPRPRGTDRTGRRRLGSAHPPALPQRDLVCQFPAQGAA